MSAGEAVRDDTRKPRRRRRTIIIVVATIVVALIATLAWLALRALQTKDELESAVAASRTLTAAASSADFAAADAAVVTLARHSAAAASVSSDPVWRAAELLPWVGANLSAVRIAAEQTHALAMDVAAPLLDLVGRLSSGAESGEGIIDVETLASGRLPLEQADAALESAARALAAVDAGAVIAPVADGVEQLTDVVAQAQPLVAAFADASAVAPTMLGADGPRTILIMLQNNAELRTGGGITGTFIAVRAENGVLSISRQADSADFPDRKSDIVPIPASLSKLYGDVAGRHVQDASITPDFRLTAQLASAWWKGLTGTAPDAVISIDPIVLRGTLKATGPVKVEGERITAANMIDTLLVQPYMTLSQKGQTAVFADAARAVFTALTSGDVDPVALAKALAEPAAQGRISVWSAHDSEQTVLATTSLAGPAARQQAAGDGAFAVYLNDRTGAKMDTFLGTTISSAVASCRDDGRRTVDVVVTLTNNAPANAGRRFPTSMTGGGLYGVRPGHISTAVTVSAPAGSFVGGVTRDGEVISQTEIEDADFTVSATSTDLAPGESTSLTFRFVTAQATDLTPRILHTPMLVDPVLTTGVVDCG